MLHVKKVLKQLLVIQLKQIETNLVHWQLFALIPLNVFIHFFQEKIPGSGYNKLKDILTAIEKRGKYQDVISKLRNDFSPSYCWV